MRKPWKQFAAGLLAAAMLTSALPMSAFAQEASLGDALQAKTTQGATPEAAHQQTPEEASQFGAPGDTYTQAELALMETDPTELSLEDQLEQRAVFASVYQGIMLMSLGESSDPYLIANADQLKELASLVNEGNEDFNAASYQLVADIDLSTVCGAGNNWEPIGTEDNSFKGSFDGNGHTVAGLYINNDSADYQGLFGNATGTGTIKNLGVIGANVTAVTNVGIVVGKVGAEGDTVTIENCYTSGTVTGEAQTGGVAGCLLGGTIQSSYNTAAVAITASYESVGGVVGYAASGASIENCYNTGTVTGVHGANAGGLVGRLEGATAENCFSAGTVTGGTEAYVAGIAASVEAGSTVTKCVALNQGVAVGYDGRVRAVVAYGPITGEASNTIADNAYWGDMKVTKNLDLVDPEDKDGYSSTKLTYDATTKAIKADADDFAWPGFEAANWENATAAKLPTLKNAGGSQSSAIPGYMANTATEIYISTAAELKDFAAAVNGGNNFSGKTVKLTANIDLSSVCSSASDVSWTPIGTKDNKFTGEFDGQNHTVSNLYISSTGIQDVGLFGYCGGTIKNLGVVNANVSANYDGYKYVGIIAGRLYSANAVSAPDDYTAHLENCYTTGTVQATGSSSNHVGGLVGYAQYSTIQNGYSTAAVTATSNSSAVGGVVGYLQDATIASCYSTGKISGSTSSGAGAGGVVGSAGKNNYAASVTNCVALNPSVSGPNNNTLNTYTGAVVGLNMKLSSAATITGSSYWEGMTVTAGATAAASKDQSSSAALTYNKDETKLKAGSSDFAWTGFDAANWENVDAAKLPTLNSIPGQSSALPSHLKGASTSDEILISTAAELATFANDVNNGETYEGKTVKLTADIDLAAIENWLPIGTQEHPFKGIFDGQNHTVSNLCITEDRDLAGLFGCVVDGTVKNVGVLNVNIQSTGGVSTAGSIVGVTDGNTTVENCYATGVIDLTSDSDFGATVGGLVGGVQITTGSGQTSTLKNCYSTVNVTAQGQGNCLAGGVLGAAVMSGGTGNTATVETCYSTGAVKATSNTSGLAYAGGVVGAVSSSSGNNTTIKNSLGLNSGVTGYSGAAAVLGTNIPAGGTNTLTGNAYWSGMSVVESADGREEAIKDGTGATALATQDGYLNDGNGKLDWAAMGFAANGWVAPTAKQLLPSFAGMTANLPAMPLDSTSKLSLAVGGTSPLVVAPGTAATLTAVTTGNGTNFTYKWYRGTKADTSNLIAGATTANYTTPTNLTEGEHTYTVRVIANNKITVDHTYTVNVTTGTPKQIVSHLDLTAKLPMPVKNGTPQTTVTDAQYTGAVTWTPNHTTFLGSYVYQAVITLTPAEGYTLDGLAANSFKYTGATSTTYDAATGKVTVTFPRTDDRTPVPPADSESSHSSSSSDEEYTINAWVTTGGTISPSGISTYKQGQDVTYTITPAAGYRIVKVVVDGVNQGAVGTVLIRSLNRDHEIGVYFDKATGAVTSGTAPKTGDESTMLLWVVLMSTAFAGMGGIFWMRRKKDH